MTRKRKPSSPRRVNLGEEKRAYDNSDESPSGGSAADVDRFCDHG
jgi:hypothetical protein